MPLGYCDKTCALCGLSETESHQYLRPISNLMASLAIGNESTNLRPHDVEEGELSLSPLLASPNMTTWRRANAPAPSISPTTFTTGTAQPSPTPTQNLVTLSSGDCRTVGSCIETPNFPDRYPSNTKCTWTTSTTSSVVMTVKTFDLDDTYDLLYITGPGSSEQTFTGAVGPDNVVVGPGAEITFASDFGMEYGGFEICLVSASEFS